MIDKVNQDQEALDGAGFTLEKKIKGDSADTWETVKVIDAAEALTQFVFSGLDDGVYRLTESTTPQGFNTMEPVEFTVYAEHGETLTSLSGNAVTGEITFTAAPDEGSLATTVVNQQGAELPETGGVGTTVFYVAGGLLIASAGILLIVRRRMKNEGQENN